MPTSPFSKFAATLVTVLLLVVLSILLSTMAAAQLKIGSGNTATADPTLPHPNTVPCKVTLFSEYKFNNFNSHSFTYTPPANCPGPWSAVILTADFSVTQGIQYDRTANIWIGDTNIYFGTTSEPVPNEGRHWSIQRNLTDYSSIFTSAQDGAVDLGNLVNKTYTGVLYGSATLYFYPAVEGQPGPLVPDYVYGFSAGPTGGTVGLSNGTSLLEQTLTLPTNIIEAYFDVFAQSQYDDEFWYFCVPNDVAGELESCGGTAFRESEITIDGTPAGVAPVYPWIFSGGIDPFLWIPTPGVQTLNFEPYRVNLTPFASLLNNGQPHTIALSVFNADNYFSATASLLLYTDPKATQITGAVTENTLAAPSPVITENLHTAPDGNVVGTVNTRSSHSFEISGYINTSAATITTTVAQDINFSNVQSFNVGAAIEVQNLKQETTIKSVVTTENLGGKFLDTLDYDWPLTIDYTLLLNADGSYLQTTTVNQTFDKSGDTSHKGQITSFNLLQNRVISTDALDLTSGFQITGNQNQSSSQRFFESNSTGYCYSRSITAANNILTNIVNGVGCE